MKLLSSDQVCSMQSAASAPGCQNLLLNCSCHGKKPLQPYSLQLPWQKATATSLPEYHSHGGTAGTVKWLCTHGAVPTDHEWHVAGELQPAQASAGGGGEG